MAKMEHFSGETKAYKLKLKCKQSLLYTCVYDINVVRFGRFHLARYSSLGEVNWKMLTHRPEKTCVEESCCLEAKKLPKKVSRLSVPGRRLWVCEPATRYC